MGMLFPTLFSIKDKICRFNNRLKVPLSGFVVI